MWSITPGAAAGGGDDWYLAQVKLGAQPAYSRHFQQATAAQLAAP